MTVRLLFLLLSSRNLPCFHKSRYLFFFSSSSQEEAETVTLSASDVFSVSSPYRYHLSFPSYLSGPPFSPPHVFPVLPSALSFSSFAAASFLSAIRSSLGMQEILSTTAKNDAFSVVIKGHSKRAYRIGFRAKTIFHLI
mgnify:CR=1 FL=1